MSAGHSVVQNSLSLMYVSSDVAEKPEVIPGGRNTPSHRRRDKGSSDIDNMLVNGRTQKVGTQEPANGRRMVLAEVVSAIGPSRAQYKSNCF